MGANLSVNDGDDVQLKGATDGTLVGNSGDKLKVDGSGVTQPVSGTVAATQSGTWTVQPGNTQNTTAWLTQDAADGPVSAGTAASKSQLMGGQYNSSLPSLTAGQQASLQVDSSGRILLSPNSIINISPQPSTGSGFCFGAVSHSATTQVPVEFTSYTEPASNSAMTLVSSSASDASAGTGARTVVVTYLDSTGAGPNTTTFTMNGTSAVTASVSNMCFVESIIVTTAGSTGSNVGTLTLKTGGGATIGTVAATENRTRWAHHYVPSGKTSYISGLAIGNSASSSGAGDNVILKVSTPTVANSTEYQISDTVNVAGGVSTVVRTYGSPIKVAGPARVRAYTTPLATSAYTTFASFDYIDT